MLVLLLFPQAIQNQGEYRRAIQKGNYSICDVCWHSFPTNMEFSIHTCPSDAFSLPQPPVCQPGVTQTPETHSSYSENSVIQTLTQASIGPIGDHQSLDQTSVMGVGMQIPCALQADPASELSIDHTEKGKDSCGLIRSFTSRVMLMSLPAPLQTQTTTTAMTIINFQG